jgi:hypothetical protein
VSFQLQCLALLCLAFIHHVPVSMLAPCSRPCVRFLSFAVFLIVALRFVVTTFLDATLLSAELLPVYVRRGVLILTDVQWYDPVSRGAAGLFLRGDLSFACNLLGQLASSQQSAVSGKAPSAAHRSVVRRSIA